MDIPKFWIKRAYANTSWSIGTAKPSQNCVKSQTCHILDHRLRYFRPELTGQASAIESRNRENLK
jgi:hypothetical protein